MKGNSIQIFGSETCQHSLGKLELMCVEKDCLYDRIIIDKYKDHQDHNILHIDDLTDRLNQLATQMDIDIVQKMFADIDTMKIKFVEGIEKNSALLAKKYKDDLLSRFTAISDCSILLEALRNKNIVDVKEEQSALPLLLGDPKALDKLLNDYSQFCQQCVTNYDLMDRKAKTLFSLCAPSQKYKNLTKDSLKIADELKGNSYIVNAMINMSQNEQLIKTQVDRNIYNFDQLFDAIFSLEKLSNLSMNFQYAETKDFNEFFRQLGAGLCKNLGLQAFHLDMSYTRSKEIETIASAIQLSYNLKILDLNFNNTLFDSTDVLFQSLSLLHQLQDLNLNFGQSQIQSIIRINQVFNSNKDLRNFQMNVAETKVKDLDCIAQSLSKLKNLRHVQLVAMSTEVRMIDNLLEHLARMDTITLLWIDVSNCQVSSLPNISFLLPFISEFCLNFSDTKLPMSINKRFRSLHAFRLATDIVYKQMNPVHRTKKRLCQ